MDGEGVDETEISRLERLVRDSNLQNAELIEATRRMPNSTPAASATSGVHIHSDGLIAVIVAMVGAVLLGIAMLLLVIAVAAVLVVAAWRDADMSSLQTVKDDGDMATARIEVHERRLLKLENPPQ